MAKKWLRIGVDIDGVLIDTDHRAFLKFCERELNWPVDHAAFAETHSWYKATGQKSLELLGETFTKFLTSVEEAQQPIEGAHGALKSLSDRADIFLITARTGKLLEATENFLATHLPDIRYRDISMDNLENKAVRIIEFGLDYFIDDSHREISVILENPNVTATLIPFPAFHGLPRWQELNDDRIHWLSVWADLKSLVPRERQPAIRQQAWQEITQLVLAADGK